MEMFSVQRLKSGSILFLGDLVNHLVVSISNKENLVLSPKLALLAHSLIFPFLEEALSKCFYTSSLPFFLCFSFWYSVQTICDDLFNSSSKSVHGSTKAFIFSPPTPPHPTPPP